MNISSMIQEALIEAKNMTPDIENKKSLHRNRSKNFVEALAKQFQKLYKKNEAISILSKHSGLDLHKKQFGCYELLYDILVCETDKVLSAKKLKSLTFIKKAIWQIESELAKNSREAVYDFNKLVLGSSENKLFIAPNTNDDLAFCQVLKELAKHCHSNTYLALIPHPSEWEKSVLIIECWKFNNSLEKFEKV